MLVKTVVGVIGLVVALPVCLFLIWRGSIFLENYQYAARVFDGVVQYDRVLASRRWFPWNSPGVDCTYAVVALSDDAEDKPPAPGHGPRAKPRDPFYRFGGDWMPTPAPELGDPKGDGRWIRCFLALGKEQYFQLSTAMTAPGGWWVDRGSTVYLYSPAAGLAFVLREGD